MGFFSSIRTRYRSFVRYNQILRVFVRYGYEELVSYLIESGQYRLIRRLIPSTTKKNAQKYTRWEKLRLVCEELGPTFIKFGQILSNRPDLLPNDLITQFERLQDNVPPFPGNVARQVVEQELKKSVDELFAWFEPEAFASASMAQVHKATLLTGEQIVLKIQRPHIHKVILEDIKVMYRLAAIFEKRIPSIRSFNPRGLVQNFEESILKELDFVNESVNVQRFANNIKEDVTDRTTHTLRVYRQYTTSKVLALEFAQGIKVSDVSQLTAKNYDCIKIARKLATSYIKQVFQYGFFHADPHPGNILVMQDGEVCFLDFGMMGSILNRDIEMFGRLFIAVKQKDPQAIIHALQQMSDAPVIKNLRSLEFAINEFVQNFSVSDAIHENEMSTVLLQLKDIIVMHDLKVPPHFYLLARSMVTIEGVIHHLDPNLDLLELAKPYLIKTFKRKFDPLKLGAKILDGIYQLGSYMEEFPQDLKNAINRINQGNVKVDLTHKGIDPMVHTVNRVSKQIVTSLIIAGLFVASSLFIIHKVSPFWYGFSTLGIIGILLAAFLTYGMLRDLRKGDHDDWNGWNDN